MLLEKESQHGLRKRDAQKNYERVFTGVTLFYQPLIYITLTY